MHPRQKLAYGAFLGAFATLVLMPYTRSFIFSGFAPWGYSDRISGATALSSDPDLNGSAAWVETWAQKAGSRMPIAKKDLANLNAVVLRACELEPENAYWFQVRAALESAQGRDAEAERAWREASKKRLWNDYQHERILGRRAQLDPTWHGWSYALAYDQQDLSVVERIQGFSRSVIRGASLETDEGLTRRVETLKNGELIKQFARTITLGEFGVEMIELAAYPEDLAPIRNPSKLVLARMYLHDQLRARGRDLDAAAVDASYRSNDGWTAFATSDVAAEGSTSLRLALLLMTCFGGGMLWAALVGLALWGLGHLSSRTDSAANLWRHPWCVVVGSMVGFGTGLATESILAGVSVFGAFALIGWTPPKVRYSGDLTLGPLYGFLTLSCGVLVSVAVAWLAIGTSEVGWSLAAHLPIPVEFYGLSPMVIGLLAVGLGFMMAVGPAYAWAYRIDPPRLVSLTLTLIGRRMFATCLMLIVLSAPVVVYGDRTLGETMKKIVENEPLYYLQP